MNTLSPRPYAASEPTTSPLDRLDLVPLTPARWTAASEAVRRLVARVSADDLVVLPYLDQCGRVLATAAADANQRGTNGNVPSRPVATEAMISLTLIRWAGGEMDLGRGLSRGLTCLVAVMVNAALDPACDLDHSGAERARIADLAEIIRGAIRRGDRADLLILLGGADTVRGLIHHVGEQLQHSARIHESFAQLWRRWLRDRITGWVEADPLAQRLQLEPARPLAPDPDAPSLDLDLAEDLDDGPTVSSVPINEAGFAGLPDDAVEAKAEALQFLRGQSYGGLALDADHYVADELLVRLARGTLRRAAGEGDPHAMEPWLALALALATALRQSELQAVVWSREVRAGSIALDPEAPILRIPLRRPAHAVSPVAMGEWLIPAAEVFAWPVPPSLYAALTMMGPTGAKRLGTPVFPRINRGDSTRLDHVIAAVVPEARMGGTPLRMAFAARIASRFGPEVAQWVLRDSLFTSLGPAYYCAVPVDEVGRFVAGVQAGWFGEAVPSPPTSPQVIGSRLALQDASAQLWPRHLQKEAYSAARKKGGARESLRAERNRLAGALAAATGHRPNDRLGQILLDSVIPEYGLVVLEDKQGDALRRTRVAATGARWLAALRRYLDTVIALTRHDEASVASWAEGVLAGRHPLFSLPTDTAGTSSVLTAADLRATMPPTFAAVSNFYRHRLNQALQARHVDWELRHAQLGWVVSPAYAMADLSPVSPQLLAERLGPAIDDVLIQDGWYSGKERLDQWSWDGVPARPWVDWVARRQMYEREHEASTRRLRQDFERRRDELKPVVVACLVKAVARCLPRFRLNPDTRALEWAPGLRSSEPVALGPDHYGLLNDLVEKERGDAYTAADGLVAERLIHDVVVRAIHDRLVSGPIPTYRRIGFTAQLSPFMPGAGLAVRQVEALRAQLQDLLRRDRRGDRAGMVQLAILVGTPYRDLHRSALLAKSAARGVRSPSHPGWLRVPMMDGREETPVVLTGVAATVLARSGKRAPTMRPMETEAFEAWLHAVTLEVVPGHGATVTPASWIAATCQVAGMFELDGPGRLVMERTWGGAVPTYRELAECEEWPAVTAEVAEGDSPNGLDVVESKSSTPASERPSSQAHFERLTRVLNPAASGATTSRRAGSRRGSQQRRIRELRALVKDVGPTTNLGLLVGFALHRLQFGGAHVRHLEASTLHKEVTRFGRELLTILGASSLLARSPEALEADYLATLCHKPVAVRADVLEEIIKFHGYLGLAHNVPPMTFTSLRQFAGARVRRGDRGTLTPIEIGLILCELDADLEGERHRVDASPDAVRLCQRRILLFLILEASGLRPGSAYGLLLGDVHLLGGGRDFVHVHRTGGYGAAKTVTTEGFVPLEGPHWAGQRERVAAWLEQEKALLGDAWWKIPLFDAGLGSGLRYAADHLLSRLHELAKWASGDRRARAYWLRKTRMTQRLRDVQASSVPTASGMYRALHASGESDVLVPLDHYIHDSAVPLGTYLDVAGRPDRAAALAATHLREAVLDAKWHKRRGHAREYFFGVVFETLGVDFERATTEHITSAPRLRRQKAMVPATIDAYARILQKTGDRTEAMSRCGISHAQADRLDEGIRALARQAGAVPWLTAGIRSSALLRVSRHLNGTARLFGLLDRPPENWLVALTAAWTRNSHHALVEGSDVVLHLDTPDEIGAAQTLLDKTGIAMSLRQEAQGGSLVSAVRLESGGERQTRQSHRYALWWVLTVVWLYAYLVASGSLASASASSR